MSIEELENYSNNLNEENMEDFLSEVGNMVDTINDKENPKKEDFITMSKLLLLFSKACEKIAEMYEKWEVEK